MPRFVILMREDDDAWRKLPREEQQALLARYREWVERLKREGLLHAGEPLGASARVLRMVSGVIHEEPYAETRQTLTGFFVIEAPGLDEATRIARGCPALTHGETVEVREIGHV
jgi:hypothetical protein